MHRTGRKRRIEPAQHPAGRSIVAKPAFRQGGSRPAVHFLEYSASIRAREGFQAVLERRLRHKFGRFVQFQTFFRARYVPGRLQRAQIVLTPAEYSVFCTSDGTPPQRVIGKQRFSASQRSHIRHLAHATVLNPVRTRRVFEHWARLMRRHNNRAAQLAIHTKQRVQKILLSNGIELRRGLIEQQHARAERQHGGQRQQLLAATRKRIGITMKPVLQTKEIAGLGNTAAHLVARHTQIL